MGQELWSRLAGQFWLEDLYWWPEDWPDDGHLKACLILENLLSKWLLVEDSFSSPGSVHGAAWASSCYCDWLPPEGEIQKARVEAACPLWQNVTTTTLDWPSESLWEDIIQGCEYWEPRITGGHQGSWLPHLPSAPSLSSMLLVTTLPIPFMSLDTHTRICPLGWTVTHHAYLSCQHLKLLKMSLFIRAKLFS